MVIKLFGYYINIFKAKSKPVEPAWQIRHNQEYTHFLHLTDNTGAVIPLQTDMIIRNPVVGHSTATITFVVDLTHIDEPCNKL